MKLTTKRTKRYVSDWGVRAKCCISCPFRIDPETGREQDPQLAASVTSRIFEASQICHHLRLTGKKEFELCRGYRDLQLTIFHRMGVISEPTDEAWNERRKNEKC
jgi:hypothetical protein